jgi:hypothetical protein
MAEEKTPFFNAPNCHNTCFLDGAFELVRKRYSVTPLLPNFLRLSARHDTVPHQFSRDLLKLEKGITGASRRRKASGL